MVLAGTDRLTTSTLADVMVRAIGKRSRVKTKARILLFIERLIDRVGDGHRQQRIAVWRRVGDHVSSEVAAGAGPVLDKELIVEPLGQRLRDQPSDDVGRGARRKADNDPHRPRRVGVGPRKSRGRG